MRYQNQLFLQREQSLLEIARKLFHTQPWDRVTIVEIANQTGIGKGTVYKHFPSKEALYARVVLERSREHLASLQAIYVENSSTQIMAGMIREALAQILADPLHAKLSLLCANSTFQKRLDPLYQKQFLELKVHYSELFSRILRDHFVGCTKDYQYLLCGLEACFHGVMVRAASEGTREPEYLDHIANFITASMGVPRVEGDNN